jgi:hypothetical protein
MVVRLLGVVSLLVAGTIAASGATASAALQSKPAPKSSSASPHVVLATPGFTPLVPARLLDTRTGGITIDGTNAGGGLVGPAQTLDLPVLNRGGVPATGVDAVVLNVTVTQPTGPSFVTVFPAGATRPNASNLNFDTGQTVPNLVIAKVGTTGAAAGKVSFYNNANSTHLLADVAGWFAAGGTDFTSLNPARLLDTRGGFMTVDGVDAGVGPLGPGGQGDLQVTGRGGVPASGVGAVVLNVTVTQPNAGSFLTVFPSGATRPNASNLNFNPGQTVPNLVIVQVGQGGNVRLYNNLGATHVLADVEGWFPIGSDYSSVVPARLLDTRPGNPTIDGLAAGAGPVAAGGTVDLQVTGRGGVPSTNVSAVVLNVTVNQPTGSSFVTVYPSGSTRPNASNLNFNPGQTVPNLVIAKVGANGKVTFYNNLGTTHLIADVEGWFSAVPPTAVAESGTSTLGGVACGTTTCVAVGFNSTLHGVVVTINAGVPAAAVAVTGNNGLNGVACTSDTACTAVGQSPANVGQVVPIASGVPGAPVDVPMTFALDGIACPSATSCMAVGSTAFHTFQSAVVPIAAGVPGTPVIINNLLLVAIACPSATLCEAVGVNNANVGVVVPITSGVPGTPVTAPGTAYLDAIACPGAVCQAGGATAPGVSGQGAIVLVSATGAPGAAIAVPGTASLDGAGCVSASLCEMGGQDASGHGVVISIAGGTPSAPAGVAGTAFIDGVACGTATLCEGVGQDTATSAPTGEIVAISVG